MASTYLTRTTTSPTSTYKCTFSAWVKRSKLGSRQRLTTVVNPSSTGAYYFLEFTSGDNLGVNDYDGVSSGGIGGSTARKFRDTNAWYHIVVAYDTTQSTGTNRIKVYVNGVEDTFNFDATGDQNRTLTATKSGKTHYIGAYQSGFYFDGSMSHVHFIDGTAYDASAFGETDSTTGEWKIKTDVSVTYGNNGFFILKDSNSVTDQSGNSNNFTVGGGTLTKTEDCPSNVFATMNPLDNYFADSTFSNGNNTVVTSVSAYCANTSTLGMNSGKFYCEMKAVQIYNGHAKMGIVGKPSVSISQGVGNAYDSYGFYANGGKGVHNGSESSYGGTSWNNNDIIGCALDLDNNKIYFSINGTWQNSGDPTSGSTGTGSAYSINGESESGFYYFACSDEDNSAGSANTYQFNFGNGYFGTTAVSSAGTNASGNGIFEYDVPTGYTALSTKGLNS